MLRSDAVPSNPAAFWSAPETKALFAHLRQTADFVIIDAPAGDELAATARFADGALVVGAADRPDPARTMAASLGASAAVETGIMLTR
jgi:Mrp family chromosome partitioning ATPase